MMKGIAACVVLLGLCYFAQGAPSTETEKSKLLDAYNACTNKTGVSLTKGSSTKVSVENWTDAEKCYAACLLEEFGAMKPDGTMVPEFLYPPLRFDGVPQEAKDKGKQMYSDCVKVVTPETAKCENAGQFYKCLLPKLVEAGYLSRSRS